ncbi:MAG: SDR family oxidoreductase [Rhizobiales bacterium]|nr:SDR family oxidoreductase [Hyphomicrobiales bacterium]
MGRLDGKVAVVTGAARGIGATLAKAFSAEGAKVVVSDITHTDACVNAIKAAGGQAIGCKLDVTNNDDIAATVKAAEAAFGPIELLLNNAGLFANITLKPFWEIGQDEWDQVMRVNVRGGFQMVKGVLPSMRRASRGKIVNISSGTFFHGGNGHMHYVASKGGVIAMTRSMARELSGTNITANCVTPGFTESDGVRENPSLHVARAPTIAGRVIKRDMVPDDLVGAIVFLMTPDSDFMTGQTLNVDGGRFML